MLQSMRSRDNGGALESLISVSYIIYDGAASLDHHWTSGPEARDHAASSSCAASPHGGTFPAAPAGGVRGGADGPRTIDLSIQFSSVQSSPMPIAVALMAERSSCGPCDPPPADSGQTTMCPTPAEIAIFNWAQHQFETCTIYDSQGPIKISI
jgi:hypothetical protein